MTHADLVDQISSKTGLTLTRCMQMLDAIAESVGGALARGEDVKLQGLGSFHVVQRAARQGRNPSTGEAIHIAATRAVKFKPAKGLKDTVAADSPKARVAA